MKIKDVVLESGIKIYEEANAGARYTIMRPVSIDQIDETNTFDTKYIKAFVVPRGIWVEIYATTLHYAPCAPQGRGFRFAVALPRNTNLPLEKTQENGKMLAARNKWLLAHPNSPEARSNGYVGLRGENIEV